MATLSAEPVSGVIFLPKNRGLAAQAERAIASRDRSNATLAHVRGEDVAHLASRAASAGRSVFAITGEDLLAEWLAAGGILDSRLQVGSIPWSDPAALFGKPALCLIARPGAPLGAGRTRVAICSRYARLAEASLAPLETSLGLALERTYVQGALETVLAYDLADAIVDIVLTGSSIAAFGFEISDVLFRSDLATLETR